MAVDVHRVDAFAESVEHFSARAGPLMGTLARSRPVPASGPRPLSFLAWAAILLAIIAFDGYAIEQLRAGDARFVGAENGPLENVQLLVMVPTRALFWFAWLRGLGAVRVAGALLAMIGTIAFTREVDFNSLTGGIAWFDWLVAHGLRDGLLAFFGLATVLYLFLQRRFIWGLLRLGLRWQAWPCGAFVLLLATAHFYLNDLTGYTGHFWEELVETNGYFLFALAAWQHSKLIGDPEFDSPLEARG